VEFNSHQIVRSEHVVSSGEEVEVESGVEEVNVGRGGTSVSGNATREGIEAPNSGGDDVDWGLSCVGSVSSAESEERRGEGPFAAGGTRSRESAEGAWACRSGPWEDWLEGVSEDSLQLAGRGTSFASRLAIITLFALVGD
jgi:hypothetical protein